MLHIKQCIRCKRKDNCLFKCNARAQLLLAGLSRLHLIYNCKEVDFIYQPGDKVKFDFIAQCEYEGDAELWAAAGGEDLLEGIVHEVTHNHIIMEITEETAKIIKNNGSRYYQYCSPHDDHSGKLFIPVKYKYIAK